MISRSEVEQPEFKPTPKWMSALHVAVSYTTAQNHPLCFFFFLKRVFFLKIQNSKKERNLFHPLFQFPNGHNSQGWARPKPGDKIFIEFSQAGGRNTAIGPCSTTFLSTLEGS